MSLANDLRDAVGEVLDTLTPELGSSVDVQRSSIVGYDEVNTPEVAWQAVAGGKGVGMILTSVNKAFVRKTFGSDVDVSMVAILKDSAVALAGGDRLVVRAGAYTGLYFRVEQLSPEYMGNLMVAAVTKLRHVEADV